MLDNKAPPVNVIFCFVKGQRKAEVRIVYGRTGSEGTRGIQHWSFVSAHMVCEKQYTSTH